MSTAPSIAAPANSIPPGVAKICDLTLGVSLRAIDLISRVRAVAPVSLLPAPDGFMLVQIWRQTRTIMGLQLSDEMLPSRCNFPSKCNSPSNTHIPRKLRFKNPTFVTPIRITNRTPRDCRVDRSYNWCTGI